MHDQHAPLATGAVFDNLTLDDLMGFKTSQRFFHFTTAFVCLTRAHLESERGMNLPIFPE
jgi:hypothetical protein